MKQVNVTVYGSFVACEDDSCTLNRECTNHTSAGDFRSEAGVRPELFALCIGDEGTGTVYCKTCNATYTNPETYDLVDPTAVQHGECVLVGDVDPQIPLL